VKIKSKMLHASLNKQVMKRNSIVYIIIAILIVSFSSCKKDEIEREKEVFPVEGDGIIINKESIIIDLEEVDIVDVSTIDVVTYNEQDFEIYEVELEGSIEEAEQIEVGTVLNIPTGDKGGQVMIVYEIIPVEEDSEKGIGAYILKSIQINLDMYFTYNDPIIEFSTPENRSKKNSQYSEKLTSSESVLLNHLPSFTSELEGLTFTTSAEQFFEGSLSTKIWESGDSYVEVNGSFGVHPAIDFYMEYEPQTVGSAALEGIVGLFEAATTPDLVLLFSQDKNYVLGNMKQLRAVVYTDVDKDMSVKVHLEKEFDFVQRIPLGKLTIPTVPVAGQVELAFELDFEAMGTLDFESYKKEEYDLTVGVDLQKELPEPVWYYEKAYREEDGFQLKAKIELTAGVSLILETEIYVLGVIGPEITMEAYVEAIAVVEASASKAKPSEVNWELKADVGINGSASLNLALLHSDPATWKIWEYSFLEYRENIYSAPDHLEVISGANQEGTFGMQLTNPIVVGAYDSKDKLIEYLPVPVYFETQNGTVNAVDYSEAGLVEANWVLDNENEDQMLSSYFKFEDTKKSEIEINATATSGLVTSEVTDIDGNVYNTVKIGDQWWMSENLKTTHYANGTAIQLVTDNTTWGDLADNNTDKAYSYFDNNENNESDTYGALYTYAAASNGVSGDGNPSQVQGACPDAWHLPSDAEWKELEMAIGMSQAQADEINYRGTNEGSKLKELGTSHWDSPNTGASNESGFTALGSGARLAGNGIFLSLMNSGYFWTSTEKDAARAWYRSLNYSFTAVYRSDAGKSEGFAVRCVKD
jgi:uncharacterized protein (TIGR02145 family)